MATAQALSLESSRYFTRKWIINSGDDLVWFIGSVVASYALLVMFTVLHWPAVLLLLGWALVFDGPHVFGTFSRTYFDREERRARALLLYGALAFFALGPALIGLGLGVYFFFFASCWAYYHLVKQHYGFMVLYKKKNGDLDRFDNFIDRFFLLAAMTYPFVRFIVYYRYMISDASNRNHLEVVARVPDILSSTAAIWLTNLLWWAFVVSAVLFAGRQLQKWWQGQPINLPKYLLLAAAIPLHWTVLYSSISIIGITPVLTIWHNIQYHRLIWFHNQNKYQAKATDTRAAYGAAAFISKSFIFYAVFGLLFNLIYHIPRGYISANISATGLLAGFFWGFAFIHYYLDSKIWRVRRDPKLNESLQMAQN